MAKFKFGDIFQLINGSPTQWKVNSIANKQYYYTRHPSDPIQMGSADISFIDDFYELVPPKFKFPIGSKISWNNKKSEMYLVIGYNYEKDMYMLEIAATSADTWTSFKVGHKFEYSRVDIESGHTLIPNEGPKMGWKFKIGDKIKNKADTFTSSYTILDHSENSNCYIFQSNQYLKSNHAIDKEHVEGHYKLCIPEQPKCIPADPQVSGWHWIRNDNPGGVQINPFPKYWQADKQQWNRNTRNSEIDPIKMYLSGNRYDKPCNY